jgi:general secretion pathway protein K
MEWNDMLDRELIEKSKGFILIPVLLIFTVIITMITEFSYEVFVDIQSLKNFSISQRLSVIGGSCLDFSIEYINTYLRSLQYNTQREYTFDLSPFTGEENLGITVTLIDENSKFNLNSFYTISEQDKLRALEGFKRLLRKINMDEQIALRIMDWIDRDTEEAYPGAEKEAKNKKLYSIEELLQIPGISETDFERLRPYITCYTDGRININTAPAEVLITLDGLSDSTVDAIIAYREKKPFETKAGLRDVPGVTDSVYQSLQNRYDIKTYVYGISIKAESSGIKRFIYGIVDSMITGDALALKYYREE